MSELFNDNFLFLFIIALVFILKPEKLLINQKIILTYSISYLVSLDSKINNLSIIIFTFLIIFIYMEFFVNSDFKREIMVKLHYKIADYIFTIFFQYHYWLFITCIYSYDILKLCSLSNISLDVLFRVVQVILLFYLINIVYSLKWEIKELDDIKINFEKYIKIYNMPSNLSESFFKPVILIEDQTFFARKNPSSIFGYIYNKYNINKYNYKSKILNKFSFNIFKKFKFRKVKKINKSNLKRATIYIRGYSTIEQQLIRSIGIKRGYRCTLRRKLFEIIYVRIFFKSIMNFYKINFYHNSSNFKVYLIYVYLNIAKVSYHNRTCTGLKELYDKDVSDLNYDELFIGTLMFSNYYLCKEDIICACNYYNFYIEEHKIDLIMQKINERFSYKT